MKGKALPNRSKKIIHRRIPLQSTIRCRSKAPPSIWRSTLEATFVGTFYISSYLKLGQERSNPFKIGARTTTHHCQDADLVSNVVMAHIPSSTCAERVWVDKSKCIPFLSPFVKLILKIRQFSFPRPAGIQTEQSNW